MTIAGYKKAIAKLLKAYHKKFDWQGKPVSKKKKKRSRIMIRGDSKDYNLLR
jgi:hypothetical protein